MLNFELVAQVFGNVNAPQTRSNQIHVNGDTCILVGSKDNDVSFYPGNLFWIDENRNPYGDTLAIDGSIYKACKDGNGGYVVVGDFVYDDGIIRKEGVLHVTKQGKVDPVFQDFSLVKPTGLEKLHEIFFADSNLYLVGSGTTSLYSNNLRSNMIMYRDSTQMQVKMPLVNGEILTAVKDSSGMIIGGNFTSVGGIGRYGLARIRNNGTLDLGFDARVHGTVNQMLQLGNSILVAGDFSSINDSAVHNFGMLDLYTQEVRPLITAIDGTISAMLIKDSIVYFGGDFTRVNGTSSKGYVGVEIGTGQLVLKGKISGSREEIYSLDILGDTLFVAGSFSNISGLSITGLAAVSRKTGNAFAWDVKANNSVRDVQVYGQKLYVSGSFSSIGGRNLSTAEIQLKTATATQLNVGGSVLKRIGRLVYSPREGPMIHDVQTSRVISHDWFSRPNNISRLKTFILDDALYVTLPQLLLGNRIATEAKFWALTPSGNAITKPGVNDDSISVRYPYVFEVDGRTYISNIDHNLIGSKANNTFHLSTDGEVFKFLADSFSVQLFDPNGQKNRNRFYRVVGDDKGYVYSLNHYFNKNTLQWEFPDTSFRIYDWGGTWSDQKIRAIRKGNKLAYYGELNQYSVLDTAGKTIRSRYVPNYIVRDFQSGGIIGNIGTKSDPGTKDKLTAHFVGSKLLFTKETNSGVASPFEWDEADGLQAYMPFFRIRPARETEPLILSVSNRAIVHGFVSQPDTNIWQNGRSVVAFNWKTGEKLDVDIPDSIEWYKSSSYGRYLALSTGTRDKVYLYDRYNDKFQKWIVNIKGRAFDFELDKQRLFLGGRFTEVQGDARTHVAAIDLFANSSVAWAPSLNNDVEQILVHDKSLIIRGDFTTINGVKRQRLASIDTVIGHANNQFFGINSSAANTVIHRMNEDTLMFALAGGSSPRNLYFSLSSNKEFKWFDLGIERILDAEEFGGKSVLLNDVRGMGTEGLTDNVFRPFPFYGEKFHDPFNPATSMTSGDLMLLTEGYHFNGKYNSGATVLGVCRPKLVGFEQMGALCGSIKEIWVQIDFENGLHSHKLPLYVKLNGRQVDQYCEVKKRNGQYWVSILLDAPLQEDSLRIEVAIRNNDVMGFLVSKPDTLRRIFKVDRKAQSRAELFGPKAVCSQSKVKYTAKGVGSAKWRIENGSYSAINDSDIWVVWNSNKNYGRVYLTDFLGGCSQLIEKNVSVMEKKPIVLNISDTTVCPDAKIELTVNESSFGNITWVTQGGLFMKQSAFDWMVSLENDTSLSFYAVDSFPRVSGCKAFSDTVTIASFQRIPLTIHGNNQVCLNTKQTYWAIHKTDTIDGVGNWTVDNNQFAKIGKGIDANWKVNGDVHYTGKDSNGCQTHSDTLSVVVKPLPSLFLPFTTKVICQGSPLEIGPAKSNQTITVEWYRNGGIAPMVVSDTLRLDSLPLGTGKIWAVPIDSQYGCKPAKIDTVSYVVDTMPAVLMPSDTFICEGRQISVMAVATGKESKWYKDGNLVTSTRTLTTKPGKVGTNTYEFKTNSTNGACTAGGSWNLEVIKNPQSGIKAVKLSEFEYDFEASKQAIGVDYTWFIQSSQVGTGTKINYEFKSEGDFTVELLANDRGCTSRNEIQIEVDTSSVSVKRPSGESCGHNIAPNPGNGLFTIYSKSECGSALGRDIAVFDTNGKEVEFSIIGSIDTEQRLLLSDSRPGVYLLRLYQNNTYYFLKVVVTN